MNKRLLTSCFGLGYLPIAPGTWGSVPPVVIFMAMAYFCPPWILCITMGALAVLGSFVCAGCAGPAIEATGRKDPSEVVVDEFAGQALTLFIVCLFGFQNICLTAAGAFLLFRIFDIVKPFPCRRLEKLKAGYGILADDLGAGIYAAIVFIVLERTGVVEYFGRFAECTGGLSIPFAAMLGAVQGLTEFLPVSSSGHLVLLEHFIPGIDPDSAEMLLFDLSIHVGTVGAIIVVYRRSIACMVVNLKKAFAGDGLINSYKSNAAVRMLVLGAVATVVTVVIYKLFKDPLESARQMRVLWITWAVTATLLLLTDMKKQTRVSLRKFGLFAAVVVGIAQGAAILPGISRSGATICAAILLGLHRRWAMEFSFLIAMPAILGGAALKLLEDYSRVSFQSGALGPFAAGVIVSFLVGIIALNLLIKASRRKKLKIFAFYCYILAGFVAVYLLSNG